MGVDVRRPHEVRVLGDRLADLRGEVDQVPVGHGLDEDLLSADIGQLGVGASIGQRRGIGGRAGGQSVPDAGQRLDDPLVEGEQVLCRGRVEILHRDGRQRAGLRFVHHLVAEDGRIVLERLGQGDQRADVVVLETGAGCCPL